MQFLIFTIFLTLYPHLSWAHRKDLEPISWSSWTFSETVTVSLLLVSVFYLWGMKKFFFRHSKKDLLKLKYFIGGIFVLVIALMSPLDPLSDILGSAHMIQHSLIMMVASPMIAMASPGLYVPQGMNFLLKNNSVMRRMAKFYQYRKPITIWFFYALTLWIWHLPILYEGALHNELFHDFQHLCFFMTSFLFWRVVIDFRESSRMNHAFAVLYLFIASLHAMILGVFMALSPVVWYEFYRESAEIFGVSPLVDQQIAGYIMWMPACLTFFFVGASSVFRLIQSSSSSEYR